MTEVAHQTSPLMSVVIVNYNGRGVLQKCLASVFSQQYRPVEVIVVDNCSTDGSCSMVRERFSSVRLIENPANVGFAAGCNQGVEAATGEYCVLLNNDTVVDEGWLEPLLRVVEQASVGVVCSKVVTEGVPPEYYAMNGTINFLGYNIMRQFANLSQVFFASGASLMFHRKVVERPFLDVYFLYHEDVYLSWRLRTRGFQVRMAPESLVRHLGSQTTKKEASALVTFYQERNRLLNCLLLYESRTLLVLAPYVAADAAAKLLLSVARSGKSLRGILRAYRWIMTHIQWIRTERANLQGLRTEPDSSVMRWMSYRIFDGDSSMARFVNWLSRSYARAAGLSYYE